ncbi:dTDP-4-dehydrorhamnose reductase [Parabacteroides sp. PFB2-12]|uniref:dTDP-4-dehydrorhamnose reductase n=1 Tax=unclassified Parabacteroides TaxID=2649774 RepID=UPI002475929D|nr:MULTISPECIES: dTDP-4-dehydrorhamnose reductase [unclassified Parabacteroides]MDH6341676.1 dTDP-4-dehydrorhamnose reductase [Parabacteroides sp. PM6-13]MDH6389901.1 dTDP-4-dehydrorhamnose reductase [Parabacteroides sp. PFB2-12]
MKQILVTGANGQLGKALQARTGNYPALDFYFTDMDTLDITNKEALFAFVRSNRIQCILNLAAYTNVEQAEEDTKMAYLINAEAMRNLAEVAGAFRCHVIHVSTDYVFDGSNHRPYVETDATRPLSTYGRTKLAGEVILQEAMADAVIVRTSWLYSEFGNNFLNTMLRLGKEKEELSVVYDQIGTPTYAGDLAYALIAILMRWEKGAWEAGIYHFSNEGVCSWYDFARKIMELAALPCKVMPVETKDYPTKAQRPLYSVLNKAKIKTTYNLTIPHWEESLRSVPCLNIPKK